MVGINIVPKNLLQWTADQPMHMALYQEIIKNDAYLQFYRNQQKMGKFIIMDNGAAEGQNPTAEELLLAYKLLLPDELILPDVVGESFETLRQSLEALTRFKAEGIVGGSSKIKVMAVPQGKSPAQWYECAMKFLEYPEITTLGISKFVSKQFAPHYASGVNVRLMLLDLLRGSGLNRIAHTTDIHLLGCYYTPKELCEIEQTYPGVVRSTDSAIAYVYTRNKQELPSGVRTDNHEIDFSSEVLSDQDIELLQHNLQAYQDLCK